MRLFAFQTQKVKKTDRKIELPLSPENLQIHHMSH